MREWKLLRRSPIMSSGHSEPVEVPLAAEDESMEELARRQGVRPVESVDDMARPGLFDSDEEWQEFLADLYSSRHAGLA
jgi:hypothetical protein